MADSEARQKYLATFPPVGERRALELPFSEACMFLRIAGKTMTTEYVGDGMVQVLNDDGTNLSFPILASEAGWHRCH
jgi:hypothetical protein